MPEDPSRDRTLLIWDMLERIAALKADGAEPNEVEELAAEYRRLRAEL